MDRYKLWGYEQIKIYSSVKPELVPVIAAEAHKYDLRVSGHIPNGMTAEQAIRDQRDLNREHSPLRPAQGAVEVDTSDLAFDEVVARIVALVNRARGSSAAR